MKRAVGEKTVSAAETSLWNIRNLEKCGIKIRNSYWWKKLGTGAPTDPSNL